MSKTGRREYRPRRPVVPWTELSPSQQAAIEAGEQNGHVTPERQRLLLPHRGDHVISEQRRLQRALRPKDANAFVNWARWAYRQEPPTRLHIRDTAKDGAPMWHGDFMAWLNASEHDACSLDDEGAFRTPFRCAVYTLHGRDEESIDAELADFSLDLAAGTLAWNVIAEAYKINPPWVRKLAVVHALGRLWDVYRPQPR